MVLATSVHVSQMNSLAPANLSASTTFSTKALKYLLAAVHRKPRTAHLLRSHVKKLQQSRKLPRGPRESEVIDSNIDVESKSQLINTGNL